MFSFLWPMMPMVEANIFLSQCQLQPFQPGLILEYDALDGVVDGVVADLDNCTFEPSSKGGRIHRTEIHNLIPS